MSDSTGSNQGGGLKDTINNIVENTVKPNVEKAKETATDLYDKHLGSGTKDASDQVDDAKKDAGRNASDLKENVTRQAEDFKDSATGDRSLGKEAGRTVQDAKTNAERGVEDVKDKASEIYKENVNKSG
ncbi:hypothetical protein TRICI_001394 [Trichomonascus ciferrii]|uniref:Uncharacterized protein n=1 Tax=Trichomonascus ciferrii TaxID=44093 RepID=A0A642V9N4_9ASCO|nr:hypothetical protein TRICI_001394 [Trichomonascus ciferrii]